MKILLIEDDKIIGENIKEYLEKNNFMVNLFSDGENGLKESLKNAYDLFIFDVMLPGKDGFEVAEALRKKDIETPIIFLTAKEDIESKERGFLVGADDYLTKPFKLKELILRIKNILKRYNKTEKIKIGEIEINMVLKEVKRGGNIINLTTKEFMILEFLMKNDKKEKSKKEILEYIWGKSNDIGSDVIRSHMLSLRKKLNKDFENDPIKTIRGVGFKFDNT